MLFNSIPFTFFLTIVFVLYWFLTNKSTKYQNVLLLIASYFFYGWWDWRFLCLLIALSVANYFIGIQIENDQEKRRSRVWFAAALIINLGILVVFKYYNFFIDSFVDLVSLSGYDLPWSTTKIILPLGISFYTFLSLSYIIDIRRKTLNANRSIIMVLLSLSFFPIILAGPIQRPAALLAQIANKRDFNYNQAVSGLWQALWGLFTKVVVADNVAPLVDDIFKNYSTYGGSLLVIGALLFTVQIYADFSAYSSMAIGVAKLFGFNLVKNFAFPYFSRDIAGFWKRWHISLTTWFRDYVFLPISFNLCRKFESEKVLFINKDLFIYSIASIGVWFLTGLWHGANYTFIIWGLMHGFVLIAYRWQLKPRKRIFKEFGIRNNNIIVGIFEAFTTLGFVTIAWVFFRSENVHDAALYIGRIFSQSPFALPKLIGIQNTNLLLAICFSVVFLFVEWKNRKCDFVFEKMISRNIYYQISVVCLLVISIYLFTGESLDFIYFKF